MPKGPMHPEPVFVNVYGAKDRLRGIDSARLGVLGFLKGLQIRARELSCWFLLYMTLFVFCKCVLSKLYYSLINES